MVNKMNNEIKKIVNEISSWCVDNHSDKFTCDYHFTGHVNWMEVALTSGGHGSGGEKFDGGWVAFDKDNSLDWLKELFTNMKEFKKWHDEEFDPENLAKKQELKKRERAEFLKKELARLESELHDPDDILATLNTEVNE
jgi:hypothetical protein